VALKLAVISLEDVGDFTTSSFSSFLQYSTIRLVYWLSGIISIWKL